MAALLAIPADTGRVFLTGAAIALLGRAILTYRLFVVVFADCTRFIFFGLLLSCGYFTPTTIILFALFTSLSFFYLSSASFARFPPDFGRFPCSVWLKAY